MKNKLKKIGIGLLIAVLLAALFLAAWVFVLYPRFFADESSDETSSMSEIAESSDYIDFDEESGTLYINNEIIVFLNDSATEDEIAGFLLQYGKSADESMADIGVYKLIYSYDMDYDELCDLVDDLKALPIVDDAYLNYVSEFETDDYAAGSFTYEDPVYPTDEWNGDSWNTSVPSGENWGMEAIDAPGAWGYLSEMSDVRIGLIDVMPDSSHEDLTFANTTCLIIDEDSGETTTTSSVSAEDHGSHVAGIMAADWNNGVGTSGVTGGKGQLYYAETYYSSNGTLTTKYATAYSYLLALKTLIDQDVSVINISQNTSRLVGFAASHGNKNAINYLTGQAKLAERGLSRIIAAREAEGKSDFVICVAAGNSNSTYYYKDDDEAYGYRDYKTALEVIQSLFGFEGEIGGSLALYNNFLNLMDDETVKSRVIVVGAVEIDNESSTDSATRYTYTDFSNVGSRVDVVAPGYDIYSCVAGGYQLMSGTSMACPHAAGVAGLIFASNPTLTGPEVKEILIATTEGRYYFDDGSAGMVNANDAVVSALQAQETSVAKVIKTSTSSGLDLCFVIDTTGSMEDDIENAKENMTAILGALAEKTSDYRVAIIDYRDFSDRSGYSMDYPYEIQLDFTSDVDSIVTAINALSLGNGGDEEETVYSGLIAAVGLNWRESAEKVIILLGDAAPLDPEPYTEYTYNDVLAAMFAADISIDYDESDERAVGALGDSLINVFSIGTNASSDAADFFAEISESTGGAYVGVDDASEVSDAIMESIDQIEVAETVTATVSFGDSMADQTVDLYSGSEYLFTIHTDESGDFTLTDIEPDVYKWKSTGSYAGGSISIESNSAKATVKTTKTFAYADLITQIREHKTIALAAAGILLALCVLIPLVLAGIAKIVRRPSLT